MNYRSDTMDKCYTAYRHATGDEFPSTSMRETRPLVKYKVNGSPNAEFTKFCQALLEELDACSMNITGCYNIASDLIRSHAHRMDYVTSFDVYRYLKNKKYFSVLRAKQRIEKFGTKEDHRRYNLKEQLTHIKSMPPVDWFVDQFNTNKRMILSLSARLMTGNQRECPWKGYQNPEFFAITRIDDYSFSLRVLYEAGHNKSQTLAHLAMFFNCIPKSTISNVFRENGTIVVELPGRKEKPKMIDRLAKATISGAYTTYTGAANDDYIINLGDHKITTFNESSVPIEDHYASQIEKSINEISAELTIVDDEIFKLSSKSGKLKAQRHKLLQSLEILRK